MERSRLKKFNAFEREHYFMRNVGYAEFNPKTPYFIHAGSMTLFSDDTMELHEQWNRWVRD